MVDEKMAKTNDKYSFTGYSIRTWATKNKDNLKLLVAGLLGVAVIYLNGFNSPIVIATSGVVTVLTKLILDGIEYWLSE
jgi:hypothetical protein